MPASSDPTAPDTARRLALRGARLQAAGDRAGAAELYRAALARDDGHAPAWFGLGELALQAGRSAEAVAMLGRAVTLRPRASWHATLSSALLAEGHAEPARAAAHVAVLRDGQVAAHHHAHALALAALGRHEAALAAWRETARHAPRDPAAQANLAAALYAAGSIEAAQAAIARARALGPPQAATLLTEGLVADALGEVAAADALLAEAERLAPDTPAIALGRAGVLFERDRLEPAEARLRDILAAAPMPQAELTLAGVLLASGRRAEGWAAFEARRALQPGQDALADWDGRPCAGTVRIEAEQGLGDTLHFLRYVAAIAPAQRLILRLPPQLRGLVAAAMPGLPQENTPRDDGTADADIVARAGVASLPHLLGDPPADPVWARPDPARVAVWRTRFAGLPGRRVGLVWQGNPDYRYDRRRSIPPALLEPLRDIPGTGTGTGIDFIALQPGIAAPDWMHVAEGLTDFAETLAAMSALDLVVGVDTAAIHLAGSAGLPVWLLDRAGGDWRWRPGFGPRLYPTLRRFAASEPAPPERAWPGVIAQLSAALREWASP